MGMTTLGERVKTSRQSLGWTQDKLAQEAGISKSFLSEIENDKANVSGENLMKLANTLDISLDYLMKGESSGERRPRPIEIPVELSEMAEELGLSHKSTMALLATHRSLVARRSTKEKSEMTKEGWRDLYERLRNYLE
jgi:transcriptional regulator with XRE-family HTH domain